MKDIDIKKLMLDYQVGQPDFTIDSFVVGSQGDDWMQYKQCLTEMAGKVEGIDAAKSELKLLKLDINRWRLCWPSRYNIEKRKTEKERKRKRLKSICNMITEYERELSRYSMHASELKKQFGSIDKKRRIELDSNSLKNKGLKLAAMDIISSGQISVRTYEFILALPKNSQIKILKTLARHQAMEVLGFSQDDIKQISPPKKEQLK